MRNPRIEYLLKDFSKIMVKNYTWLTIKFEYNENKQQYLVSYSPKDKIQSDNEFITDSMMLEDMFNDYFGDYAPLFCDEEEYFKLSPNAEVIKYESK